MFVEESLFVCVFMLKVGEALKRHCLFLSLYAFYNPLFADLLAIYACMHACMHHQDGCLQLLLQLLLLQLLLLLQPFEATTAAGDSTPSAATEGGPAAAGVAANRGASISTANCLKQ